MRKICNRLFLALFGLALAAVPAFTFVRPEKKISYYENRALAEKPALTGENVRTGQYFSGWDTWLSDHIVGRNTILKSYARIQRALPKVEANNIIETGSGALLLMASPEDYDPQEQKEIMDKKTGELKALAGHVQDYGGLFCYVGVPGQRYVYYDEYPEYLSIGRSLVDYCEGRVFDALADTDAVAVNMREVFDATGDAKRYYSALDNHYNYDGVLLTYRTLMKAINERLDTPLKVYEDRDLVFHTEEQEFFGSYSRRICNLQARKEHLVWAEPKEPVPFTREDGHVRVPANTFEQPAPAVSTYAGYMGGDIGETVIRTGRDDLPSILVFGDSFTNPLEGLLYASCGEFRSLDFRHYDAMTLYEYIDLYQPDIVIAVRDNMSYNQFEDNGAYR
ncbi:MAG: hypothetical protein KHW93_07885 [Butyricicoccus pullicaecorum]|nr:hypothetical protein [Butyricicoccus pullicaecorum]